MNYEKNYTTDCVCRQAKTPANKPVSGLFKLLTLGPFMARRIAVKEGVIKLGYFKTSVEAGATIEVTKSYTKRIGVKVRRGKEKPTAEEIEKINQMNAERTLRLKINNNFGVDDPFITLTYRKDERPEPEKAKKDMKKLIDGLRKEFKKAGADLKWVCAVTLTGRL